MKLEINKIQQNNDKPVQKISRVAILIKRITTQKAIA
jgi:hypothetical protein